MGIEPGPPKSAQKHEKQKFRNGKSDVYCM
jgi:hypothetical protein